MKLKSLINHVSWLAITTVVCTTNTSHVATANGGIQYDLVFGRKDTGYEPVTSDPPPMNLYRLDLETGFEDLLVEEIHDYFLEVSPNGERVLFSSFRAHECGQVCIYELDDGQILPTSPQIAYPMSLAWSPDNKSILLASWYLEPPGIYIYNTETGALRLVAELSSPVSATWHPDGELITVFNPPGFYDTRYIRLIEVDSGTYRMTRSGNKQRINSPAIWSPDGQSLAISGHSVYVIETRLINSYVFLEELQSIVLDEELNNTYFWQTPKWSPSGSQIVVSGLNYENEEPLIILLIDPHTMLSRVLAFGEQPEWSPDGEWIAFVAFSEDTESNDIFIIRPDGSDLTQITQTESDELLPHWVTKQL